MRCSAEPRLQVVMKFRSLKRFWSAHLLPHSSRQGRFVAPRIYSAAGRPVFVLQLQRTKCFCTDSCIFWWRRRGLSFQKSKRSRRPRLNGVLKWFSARGHRHKLWDCETKPKQHVEFIFKSGFLVVPASLKSMFKITDLICDRWLLFLLEGTLSRCECRPGTKSVYLCAAKSVFVLLLTVDMSRMHEVAQQFGMISKTPSMISSLAVLLLL